MKRFQGSNDKKDAILMARIDEASKKNYEPHFFDFCDGATVAKLKPFLNAARVPYVFWGGIENAERQMLCVYPEYLTLEDLEWPLMAFRFTPVCPIEHRHVLGELMALGITRECLGDIHVSEEEVQVIFVSRLYPFLKNEVKGFRGCSVKLQWVNASEIKTYQPVFKDLSIVAASDRVDGIIGKIWGFSRQEALFCIKQNRLKVNYVLVTENDHRLAEGDVLSLRGKGKARVAEISNQRTKKGHLRILIQKYQ